MQKKQLSNYPVWFDGTSINEAAFCEEFLYTHKILFANNAFFTPEGRITDDLPLRGEIFESLKHYAINNVPRKVTNILEVMKLAAYVEDFPPEANKIHLANGRIYIDGSFIPEKPDIVRMRLPVNYNPYAPETVTWLAFLEQLLYPEDIPTLQEFIGYCLIPNNKGQRMTIIKGNGDEGKSQIGAVLNSLYFFNAGKNTDKAVELLQKFFPAMENFQTQVRKYDKTISSLKSDNVSLKRQTQDLSRQIKEATSSSIRKKMNDARLRADYENLQNLMNRIPPEILELAKRGQLTHSDRER